MTSSRGPSPLVSRLLVCIAVVATAAACGGPSPARAPAAESDGDPHYAAVCDSPGHPPWRTHSHPSFELAKDEADLHVQKFPGHQPRVEPVRDH
jgi:hypothetical protein